MIKNTATIVTAVINILFVAAMIITGYGGNSNPVEHSYIAVLTLSFPILVVINILFIIFWTIFKFKLVLISLTGFVICYKPVYTYCPINFSSDPPADALKIMSYNIRAFSEYDFKEGEENPSITYLESCNADIICLQEAIHGDRIDKLINKKLAYIYPYRDFDTNNGNGVAIMSKFPIVSKESIEYTSDGNLSRAWKVDFYGDTILVINNHLESNKLSNEDREMFKKLVKENINDENAKEDSKWLFSKLAKAAVIRAPQADSVARYIEKNKHISTIVCGDFNDSPLSYARKTISQNLQDCFIERGLGPGISYHRGGFYVRIDNIMCSKDWEVFKCEIDNKTDASDHYPIYTWIKKRHKTMKNNN